jgi:hypothetical protein
MSSRSFKRCIPEIKPQKPQQQGQQQTIIRGASELEHILQTIDVFEVCRLCLLFNDKLYTYVSRCVRIVQLEDGKHYASLASSTCCHIQTLCLCYLLQFWGCSLGMPMPPTSSNDYMRDEIRTLADQLWRVLQFPVDRERILSTFILPVEGGNSLNPSNTILYFIGGIMEKTNRWMGRNG